MSKKIFDDRGFLSPDGKSFVNEVFTKEVKKIINTAFDVSDVNIISGILKSIVGEVACSHIHKLKHPLPEPPTQPSGQTHEKPIGISRGGLKLIKTVSTNGKVIPFPSPSSSIDLEALVGALSDSPTYLK